MLFMLKRLTCLVISLLLYIHVNGQQDSVLVLKEIPLTNYRIKKANSGSHYLSLDSIRSKHYSTEDIGTLLSKESSVFIKSQGPGNLATTSIWGAGASHTAVLWNGFNINNNMNGLVDLSLIPSVLHDNVGVQFGGSTASWGSGAVGGAIQLSAQPKFKSGLSISANSEHIFYNSKFDVNASVVSAAIAKGTDKFYGSLKTYYLSNDNRYPFSTTNQLISGREENIAGETNNLGIVTDLYWLFNAKHSIEFHYWLQNLNRNVSPALLETNTNAFLSDESHRLSFQYSYYFSDYKFMLRSGYFNKDLLFRNSSLDDSPSKSETLTNEIILTKNSNLKHFTTIGLNHNFNVSRHKNYATIVVDNLQTLSTRTQNRFALFGSYKYDLLGRGLSFSISARQEWVQNIQSPFTYSFGGNYKVNKQTYLGVSFSRIYRTPNLNDLYWNPGGNPDLLSESGFSAHATLNHTRTINELWNLNLSYAVFYREVENWIQWTPGIVWSPQNLLQVESFGNDVSFNLNYTIKKWNIGLSSSMSYAISRNIKETRQNLESVNKQLIYTPQYQGNAGVFLHYKNWQLNYHHQYVGYVYIATDHSAFLEPYSPARIRVNFIIRNPENVVRLWCGVNNLYNQDYSVVAQRPMPLRHFTLGLNLNIN